MTLIAMTDQKKLAREELQDVLTNNKHKSCSEKACERLRSITAYRSASTLFISPSAAVTQACINGLNDRKQLILPSPAFKDGFYLLKPEAIPFPKRSIAVSSTGVMEYGEKITTGDLAKLSIEFAITGAVSVDLSGNRLGEGHGFFDLAIGMLAETGALTEKYICAAIIHEEQIIDSAPCSPWDIPVDIIVSGEGIIQIKQTSKKKPQIHWQELEQKCIRKATPLWNLYCLKTDRQ